MNTITICGTEYKPRFWRDAEGDPACELVPLVGGSGGPVPVRLTLESTFVNGAIFTVGDWAFAANVCTNTRLPFDFPSANLAKIKVEWNGPGCV